MRHLLAVQLRSGGLELERGNYNWNISNSEHGTMLGGGEWRIEDFFRRLGSMPGAMAGAASQCSAGSVVCTVHSLPRAPVQGCLAQTVKMREIRLRQKTQKHFCRTMNVTLHFYRYSVFCNNKFCSEENISIRMANNNLWRLVQGFVLVHSKVTKPSFGISKKS